MSKYVFSNRASTTLAAPITSTDTNIPLAVGTGQLFPSPASGEVFNVTIIDVDGNHEIVQCTARVGDALTVTRGVENTTARNFDAGSRVELRLTAGVLATFLQGTSLPPLNADLDLGGHQIVNINWSNAVIDAAVLKQNGVSLVPETRTITAGTGLTGGGALNQDRSLAVQFASDSETINGTVTDKAVTPANLAALTGSAFTTEVDYTPGAVTNIANGLGGIPGRVSVVMRCTHAHEGYVVGELLPLDSIRRGENNIYATVSVNDINISLIIPNNCRLVSKLDVNNVVTINPLMWKIKVSAWR